MSTAFDPVAWAASRVGAPGQPAEEQLPEPAPDGGVIVDLDLESLAVTVPPGYGAAALEGVLRERGLTLGLFPESFERATIGELLESDAPGAGASGPGFASRLLALPTADEVTIGVRRRPAMQAGRALTVDAFADAVGFLRRLAQDGDLPDVGVVFDEVAADLWLSAAGNPDDSHDRVPVGGALLILITAGGEGTAARQVARAIRDCQPGSVDLGQNVARGWAGARYDLPGHAAALAAAGYRLETTRERLRWRSIVGAAAEARVDPDGIVACEVTGAMTHDALLIVRRIAPAG